MGPLLQRHTIEQLAVGPTSLPLIKGDVTYRITIFHDYPGMRGIDPIHIAAPGVLAQLQQFPGFQVCLEGNEQLQAFRLGVEVGQIALWVGIKAANPVALKRCAEG